jgi:hypothetical protein
VRHHPAALTLTAIALAVVISGCGISNPYATGTATTRTTESRSSVTRIDADPAPERGGTIPSAASRAQDTSAGHAGALTPEAALKYYAEIYINWSARTVGARQRRLASISLGGARAQALQAAASYAHDSTLTASHVTNTGTVVSIAAGQGVGAGQWVVVTSETTSGQGDYQGLPAQLHVTYSQLTYTRTGWVVSEWSPQT